MKKRLGVKDSRPLTDFLPTLTIAAKNLATEITNYNVEGKNLFGESAITREHMQNNQSVREMLGKRGIRPEELPPAEDIKKLERRVAAEENRKIGTRTKSDAMAKIAASWRLSRRNSQNCSELFFIRRNKCIFATDYRPNFC